MKDLGPTLIRGYVASHAKLRSFESATMLPSYATGAWLGRRESVGPTEQVRLNVSARLIARVPALRGIGIVVEIAAHAHQLRPFGEGEVAAHRWSAHVAVEFGELGAIDEVDTPLLLDARAAVDHFVGMGVGVASRPDVNRAGMCGKVVFKGLCLRLVTEEIEIRGSFGCPVGAVISPGPEGPVGVPRDTFEVAGPDRRFPQHVMGAGHDDVVF